MNNKLENINTQTNNKILESIPVTIEKDGNEITFFIENKNKASLQCEVNEEKKIIIARIIVVDKNSTGEGLGTKLFVESINYAKSNELKFVTDYGISSELDGLIQSLISKGYKFIRNPNSSERQGSHGKRIVTFDGSPVYSLEE